MSQCEALGTIAKLDSSQELELRMKLQLRTCGK